MITDSCKSYNENAKKIILEIIEEHYFKDIIIAAHKIIAKKRDKDLLKVVTIHFYLCSETPNENVVTLHAQVESEQNSIHDNADQVSKHKAEFWHEELLKPNQEMKTIERCLEYILNQQDQYIANLCNH